MLQKPGQPQWPGGLEVALVITGTLSPSLLLRASPQDSGHLHTLHQRGRKSFFLPATVFEIPGALLVLGSVPSTRRWCHCGSSLPPSHWESPKEVGERPFWAEPTRSVISGTVDLTHRLRRCEEKGRVRSVSKSVALVTRNGLRGQARQCAVSSVVDQLRLGIGPITMCMLHIFMVFILLLWLLSPSEAP